MMQLNHRLFLLVLSTILFISSCGDDEGSATSETEQVNQWILSVMEEVYFWTDEIPANPNLSQDPGNFFTSLLSSQDRFSAIFADFNELTNQLDGVVMEAGYELAVVRENGTNNVVGAITYIKENSPAQSAGLQRGDIIRRISGQAMNTNNFRSVLQNISQNHTIDYERFNFDTNQNESFQQDISVIQLSENPNFLDTTYTTQNGKKVGYYVYNFFSQGVGSSTQYRDEMDQIFAGFKAANIDELILDLRYNSGGSVASATNFASLIAPGVTSETVFFLNRWNDLLQQEFENDPKFESSLRGNFLEKTENIGDNLTSQRIFVLVGPGTASASELMINGLIPFLNVIIIGGTTVGKNVGSIPIEDTENPDNNYGLLPIVFQIANSLGQSDYADGFVPGPEFQVTDFQFPLRQLGDVEEPLLSAALAEIEGQLGGRKSSAKSDIDVDYLMSTKELNPVRQELVIR
ncbi:S41 family peptidase [Fulvivirga sp. M361]|uniref:S41 family peptidase n=1 Tax=Fulvivirga sp. M361 TaxID=2594266 RepID=UPI001625B799|nr:S41 family peptidase [Fulvivirga sp. M361]